MGALQIDEDPGYLRKMWLVERAAWLLLIAVLLAAALGAFGTGLFSKVEVGPPDGSYTLSYGRFERMQSPAELRVVPARPRGRHTLVWINASYLDQVSIAGILPRPESVILGSDRILFRFSTGGGPSVAAIRFNLEGERAGRAFGELGVDDREAVQIRQFYYP